MTQELTVLFGGQELTFELGESTVRAEAAALAAEEILTDTIAAGAVLGGAADNGDVPTSTGVPGAVEWKSRKALGDKPTRAVDTSATTQVQHFNQIASPAGRATLGSADGVLTIEAGATISTHVPSVIAGTTQRTVPGTTFVVEGQITDLPSIQTGLEMAWLTEEPEPGGAPVVTPAGSCLLVLRGNGTIGLRTADGSTNFPGGTVAFPGGGGSPGSVGTFSTERLRLIVTMLTTTTALCVPVIGGVAQLPRLLGGLPANAYFGGGLRIAGATCAGTINRLEAHGLSLDVPLRIYLDPAATEGEGDGSRDNPFATLAEVQFALDTDASRTTAEVLSKGGTLYGTLSVDGSRWRGFSFIGAAGQKTVIDCSVLIESGWELVGGTGGAVYRRLASDVPYPGNSGYGGYVDVTPGVTQAHGKGGFEYTVEGWALLSRLPVNTSPDDVAFVPGSYCRHNSGDDAGYDFIRCWDDGDPNVKQFRRSVAGVGIEVVGSDQEGWTNPRITIHNVEVHYPFLYGFNIRGCVVDLQNLYVRGSQVGFGFELDGSEGGVKHLIAEGCGFDGGHADGTLSIGDRQAVLVLIDCWSKGIANLPQGFGDGFSAHTWPRNLWIFVGGGALGVGKDGAAMSGESYFHNFRVTGAINCGIEVYSEETLTALATVLIDGGLIEGCTVGLLAGCGLLDACHRRIEVHGMTLLDNDAAVQAAAYGAGSTAVIRAVRVQEDGCGPMILNGAGASVEQRLSNLT